MARDPRHRTHDTQAEPGNKNRERAARTTTLPLTEERTCRYSDEQQTSPKAPKSRNTPCRECTHANAQRNTTKRQGKEKRFRGGSCAPPGDSQIAGCRYPEATIASLQNLTLSRLNMARRATSVFPKPTSPHSNLSMGIFLQTMSFSISVRQRSCAHDEAYGHDAQESSDGAFARKKLAPEDVRRAPPSTCPLRGSLRFGADLNLSSVVSSRWPRPWPVTNQD